TYQLAQKDGKPLGKFGPHDLRRTASTLLHEAGYNSDWIEKCLAHEQRGVRAIYNKAEYREQRRQMLQDWADMIDEWTLKKSRVGNRSTPTRCAKALAMASWLPTRSFASDSTKTFSAGARHSARWTNTVSSSRIANTTSATTTGTSSSKSAPNWSPPRSPSTCAPPTASPRPASFAHEQTTPSVCGRQWSTRIQIPLPPTAHTSCESPVMTTTERPSSTISTIRNRPIPSLPARLGSRAQE